MQRSASIRPTSSLPRSTRERRGAIVPIVAVSLLVILLAIALVLDRSLLDTAQVELLRAAEAGALGAARSLADDDLLRQGTDDKKTSERVHKTVRSIVAENTVSGERVEVVPNEDVQIGKLALDDQTGSFVFLEADHRPTTVRVTLRLTQYRENPVAMLMRDLTGQPGAELAQQVAATADNRVLGVRPYESAPVPAIPFAILADDPTNRRTDTWQHQIVLRMGKDRFGYDEQNHKITSGPDGIPEIVLTGEDPRDSKVQPNVAMVDFRTGLRARGLVAQIRNGLTEDHLRRVGGELRLPAQPVTLPATARLTIDPLRALASLEGECRVCLLYLGSTKEGYSASGSVHCVGIVAGRVMQVIPSVDRASQIVFQPGVIVTRTAILSELSFDAGRKTSVPREWLNPNENKYVYKTRLTQ